MGAFSPLPWKIGAAILLLVSLLVGYGVWHHHVFAEGAASVQAKWDAQKITDAAAVAKARAQADVEAGVERATFNALAQKYEDRVNAQLPSQADAVASAAASGAVRLRDDASCDDGHSVPEAASRSRAADAAATAALAQRVADSVAAVRVGDAADARERQLRAQVAALQGALNAERGSP